MNIAEYAIKFWRALKSCIIVDY